jgi:redox-sensitive bicupin YhaK (pirin superfamily)
MPITQTLTPHSKELSPGFNVRRLLPSAQTQGVGPFLFFDHFGPVEVAPGANHDVRPHPHIGLATVSYLFEGAMMHRDSLGEVQRIEPGAVNLMTAGRGIVHSERIPDDLKQTTYRSHGLQLWMALPAAHEESEPMFSHTPAREIPQDRIGSAKLRVLMGNAFGLHSPVPLLTATIYVDVQLPAYETLTLPLLAQELGIYLLSGAMTVDGVEVAVNTMAVLDASVESVLRASADAHFVLIGGDAIDGHRHMSWNFVATRKELITKAAADWDADLFAKVPGETERIPLPDSLRDSLR